jgi:hypothetical protein
VVESPVAVVEAEAPAEVVVEAEAPADVVAEAPAAEATPDATTAE